MIKNKKYFEVYLTEKPAEVFALPSPKMIKTLKKCYQMELDFPGRPYGPSDFKESFLGLYKRGLLDIKPNCNDKSKPACWFVTTKGMQYLLTLSNTRKVVAGSTVLNNINNLKANLSLLHKSIHTLKITSGRIPGNNRDEKRLYV